MAVGSVVVGVEVALMRLNVTDENRRTIANPAEVTPARRCLDPIA
ncbi:hypothetical protein RSSM_04909 [Rhodopirellula sallentina SM41]|uniref:Uncharacterized protein n=1 Tax=Rhodopirellula sallentina SM41 TaxID=1263870 RepID=M5UCD8_9BACT|nr:hypothetical protein RSSM_04909 [Rhodopirellula sallentina SM41]